MRGTRETREWRRANVVRWDKDFQPFLISPPRVDLQEATSEPACAGHADRPGIRVAEYCLVIDQWHLLLWCGEIDSAPRSCCGLREKTPLNFLQRVVEKLSNALREGGPKSQKGLPDPPCLRMRLDTAEKNSRYFFLWGATAAGDFPH